MSDKKPDFSNVVGGSSSTAEEAPSATVGPPEPRFYVVQKGDTLSKIAKQFYGETSGWRRIFNANKDQIKDPDLIQPGWKLTIPEENDDKGGVA
jgi:nucleoid-associated protein YgaU